MEFVVEEPEGDQSIHIEQVDHGKFAKILGGNFGLHAKTILPPSRRFRNTSSSGASGEMKRQSDPKPPRRLANRAAVAIGIFTPVFSPCAHQTGCAVPHPNFPINHAPEFNRRK